MDGTFEWDKCHACGNLQRLLPDLWRRTNDSPRPLLGMWIVQSLHNAIKNFTALVIGR